MCERMVCFLGNEKRTVGCIFKKMKLFLAVARSKLILFSLFFTEDFFI